MNWRITVATVLLIAGCAIEVVAVLGLCALRNVYDRLHYVGLVSFGAPLIAAAIVFRESFSLIGDKALLVAAMLIMSGPVLVHTTLRSLLIRDRGDWRAEIERSAEDEHP